MVYKKYISITIIIVVLITLLNFLNTSLSEGSGTFFEGFESGNLSNWTLTVASGANNCTTSATDPLSGTYHADCQPQSTSEPASVMERNVSTSGYENITFSYYRKLIGLDAGDEFKAMWYNGTSWIIVEETLGDSANDANYSLKTFNLTQDAENNAGFKIKFECTAGAVSEFCRIDNITIQGDAIPPDTTNPVINSVSDSPDPVVKNTEIKILANVTDNSQVDSVLIEINGTNYTMIQQSTIAGVEEELFDDDFEFGTLNAKNWILNSTGEYWTASNENPMNGTFHAQAHQTGAGDLSFMEVNIDTTDHTNIIFSYYRKLVGLDAADDFAAEWHNGTIWIPVEQLGGGIENNANYVLNTINLTEAAENNPNFKIRFMCETGAVTEYCRVDNVTVKGILSTGSDKIWEYDYKAISLDIINYTIYANDTSNNNATPQSRNFTVIESNVTISEIVRDSNDIALNTTLEIQDENNLTVYNETKVTHIKKLPKGKYKVKIRPQNNAIKQIDFNEINVSQDLSNIIDIETETSQSLFSVNPRVSSTGNENLTITIIANGTQDPSGKFRSLEKCTDWNFTTSTCNGNWTAVAILKNDSTFEFTINLTDPGFRESVTTCGANNEGTKNSFNDPCDDTTGANLEQNDGTNVETQTYRQDTYAGLEIQSVNTSVDCSEILTVEICYERWVSGDPADCSVSVNADLAGSFTTIDSTCPGLFTNPGVTCTDVTANESWTCGSFFGKTGTRGEARMQNDKGGSGGVQTLTTDVFYFNITYVLYFGLLNVSIDYPINNTNVAQNSTFVINASVTCEGNSTVKCGTVEATARYNASSTNPDTAINTTREASPLYITDSSRNFVYTGFNFSLANEDTSPLGVDFNGTNFYIVGSANDRIYEYYVNGTYTGFNFSLQASDPTGLTFNGTHFYVANDPFISNSRVYEYLANGTYTGFSFEVQSETSTPSDIAWGNNFIYVIDGISGNVYEYFAGNGTYTGFVFDTSNEESFPNGITFYENRFYVVGTIDDRVYEYNLSGNYTGNNFYIGNEELTSHGIAFNGTNFYIVGTNDRVYEYVSNINPKTKELNGGDTFNVSWTINATGLPAGYQIDVLFNSTTNYPNVTGNTTENRRITITGGAGDTTPPTITIDSPTNTTFTTGSIDYNITLDESLHTSLASVDENANMTMINDSNTHYYNLSGNHQTLIDGFHNITFWVNDTSGNANESTLFFTVAITEEPAPEAPPSGGGGGGGAAVTSFALDKDLINVKIKQGETKREEIIIENTGSRALDFNLTIEGINEHVILDKELFKLASGKSENVNADFFSSENEPADIHAGRINVKGGTLVKPINVILEILEKVALFDIRSELVDIEITGNQKLKAEIFMINLGDLKKSVDITLEYFIEDFSGNRIKLEEETLAVEGNLTIERKFFIPELEPGDYLFVIKLTHLNSTATSANRFTIIPEPAIISYVKNNLEIVVISGIILLILLYIIIHELKKSRHVHHKKPKKYKKRISEREKKELKKLVRYVKEF